MTLSLKEEIQMEGLVLNKLCEPPLSALPVALRLVGWFVLFEKRAVKG